jgi:hypothetical protein
MNTFSRLGLLILTHFLIYGRVAEWFNRHNLVPLKPRLRIVIPRIRHSSGSRARPAERTLTSADHILSRTSASPKNSYLDIE